MTKFFILKNKRLNKFSWLILPIFLVVSLQFVLVNFKMLKEGPAQDFEVFYLSGQQVTHRQNPYLRIGKDIVRNPPPAVMLFALFPLFPITVSQTLWFILSTTTFIVGSYLLFKILEISGWKLWLSYLSLVFIFFPFRYNLGSGQVNNFLFLLIVFTFYFSLHKKDSLSGFSLALAIILKITPVLLLYPLILQKRVRIFLWCIFSLILIMLVTAVLTGFGIYKDYLAIPNSFLDFSVSSYYNQSFAGLLARLLHNTESSKLFVLLTLIAGLAYFFFLQVKLRKSTLRGNLITWNISILYMLIFAPFAWQYHFVIAVFPLLTTAYLGYKLRLSFKFFLILATSYLLIGWNIKNPLIYFSINSWGAFILSHVFFGVALLLFLNYYLARKLLSSDSIR